MNPSLARGIWWVVLLCIGVYAFTSFFGSRLMTSAAGTADPLIIRDVIEPGFHRITGMMHVAYSCENVSVEAHALEKSYVLEFNTWRDDAYCTPGPVARDFALIVPAPADAHFTATLDGKPLDIGVQRFTPAILPDPIQK